MPTLVDIMYFLPCPSLSHSNEQKVAMSPLRDGSQPFVSLAFKLEVGTSDL